MKNIHYHTIDSTNSEAARLVAASAITLPVLVTADVQTAGRGRNGRTWQSPKGGAWLSVIWPVTKPVEHYAAVPLVAGLATLRTIRRIIDKYQCSHIPQTQIKWPNDVLLDDRKVAGILCETAFTRHRISSLVIGVGINVDFALSHLQGDLRHTPTTLHDSLRLTLPVRDVVDIFATQFEILMNRFDDQGLSPGMLRELRSNLAYVGENKTWHFAGELIKGEITGIDSVGRLLLLSHGQQHALDYGEINAPEAIYANA